MPVYNYFFDLMPTHKFTIFRDSHIIFNDKYLVNVWHHIIIIHKTHNFFSCHPHICVQDYIFSNNTLKKISIFSYVHKTQKKWKNPHHYTHTHTCTLILINTHTLFMLYWHSPWNCSCFFSRDSILMFLLAYSFEFTKET